MNTNEKQEKIKVALVGSSGASSAEGLVQGFNSPENWGLQHVRVLSAHPKIDFCAVVGRNAEKTKFKAEPFGARAYTDVQKMIQKEQPDIVSICLPNQQHFDVTLQVIKEGIPILVEKPLVFNLKEAEILIAEAEKRNLFFAINFNHRYAVPVQKAHKAIKGNKLGDIIFSSWRFGGEGYSDHPHANLIETQCHGFDMMEYLCGPIESVMAEMTDKTGKGYSTMVLSLNFENGSVGSFIGSYDTSYAYTDTHRVEINGTQGRLVIRDTVKQYDFQESGNETAEVWSAGYFNDIEREFSRTFDRYLDDLVHAYLSGFKPPVPAQKGFRALLLAHTAVTSFETGKRIKVGTL